MLSDKRDTEPARPERGHCIFPTLTEPIGEPAPEAALGGVRVLDLATLFPAPMVAAMLGDLGADVVKVEPPAGDPLRVTGAMRGDRTFVWALADRNKRALSVDFDSADGVAVVQRLTAVADVVVLNQPRRVLERWGCTYDEIAARNPGAIVVLVTGFGIDGPNAERPGNQNKRRSLSVLIERDHCPIF